MLIALKCVSLTLLEPLWLVQELLYVLHTCMHTFIPTYLPTYLPIYLPTYLPTCLPTYLCKYIYTYIHIYSENCFIHNWIIRESWLTNKLTEVKLILYQAMEAQRGSTDIALLFLNLGTRWGRWSIPVSMNTSRCSAFTYRIHMVVIF